MRTFARRFFVLFLTSIRDLLPLAAVILFFQTVVLQQPFPNLDQVLVGALLVVVGLTLFLRGLEMGLFPLGEAMADAFACKGSLTALVAFAFALGFGTTIAEPALIAVATEAAAVAAEGGAIAPHPDSQASYARSLRIVVAVAVGGALVLGVFRILKGWPIRWLILGGYVAISALAAVAPDDVVGIALDSGGVAISTVTVPMAAALAVGLATSIRGRNPAVDGFGVIAIASLMPIALVLAFGVVFHG